MKKVEEPLEDGTTPPASYWQTSQSIQNVYFSMAKIPQLLDDGSTLYPDGTIHYTDGTVLNPLTNTDIYISTIHLQPGELLNTDYSVVQTDGRIRYPNGILEDITLSRKYLPTNTKILPNGTLLLPPNPSYPQGSLLDPGTPNRTNYYLVGNPLYPQQRNLDNTITLPSDCYLSTSTNELFVPPSVLPIPPGSSQLSTTTIKFPTGTTKETSVQINRNNALILPETPIIHGPSHNITYQPSTYTYTFPVGSDLVYDNNNRTAQVIFPDASTIPVPYSTVRLTPNQYVFPYGTQYIHGQKKFIFPGEIYTLPLSATINQFPPYLSVTFSTNAVIDFPNSTITLEERNSLTIDGNAHLYDGTQILLNSNNFVLYNGYQFYPRGTQKNSLGTIIHPQGTVPIPSTSYVRYYPTKQHPTGLTIRPTDASIVNQDSTFTKLDYSIVDQNGQIIQQPNTPVFYYPQPPVTPFLPTTTQTTFIVINNATASHQLITIPLTTLTSQVVSLLSYQWAAPDTSHLGLFRGEFTIHYQNNTKRTFPIQKGDSLFIEVLDHFAD
jgi:hypothetical protein